MADMADLESVEHVWQELSTLLTVEQDVLPVTYINSAADLKAFCGRHGGIVCTSGNAKQVLTWAFEQREKVLFFPDEHLGRNTAYQMGISPTEMVVWDVNQPQGGLSKAQILNAKIILWQGFCSVHQTFQVQDIKNFRAQYPDTKVIAHPECTFDVCQQADEVGSTEFIIKTIKASPKGTRWLVGTEWNLVNRLAEIYRAEDKYVHYMSPLVCQCSTMFRIDPQHLLWILENLVQNQVMNQITVAPAIAEPARVALQRMLDISI
jgi:quinolinate synthase